MSIKQKCHCCQIYCSLLSTKRHLNNPTVNPRLFCAVIKISTFQSRLPLLYHIYPTFLKHDSRANKQFTKVWTNIGRWILAKFVQNQFLSVFKWPNLTVQEKFVCSTMISIWDVIWDEICVTVWKFWSYN